eukprot:m.258340 g.258340  ORF g.258340 m.258340 type:complete len:625 (-) comp36445_c0_seq1:111-1985(-)
MSDFDDADGMFDDADDDETTQHSEQLLQQLSLANNNLNKHAEVEEATSTNKPVPSEPAQTVFYRATKFNGSKEGFVFYKGARGLGYYKDVPHTEQPKPVALIDPTLAAKMKEPLPSSFSFGSMGDLQPGGTSKQPGAGVSFNFAGADDDFTLEDQELEEIDPEKMQDESLFPSLAKGESIAFTPKKAAWPRAPPPSTSRPATAKGTPQTTSTSNTTDKSTAESTDSNTAQTNHMDEDEYDENDHRAQVLIVDSGAFLKNAKLETLGRVIVTIPEVIAEIRNKDMRDKLAGVLPYTITFRQPHPKSIRFVSEFSKLTGDYGGLSAVDLKVLALAHTYCVEFNGEESINKQPKLSLANIPVGGIKAIKPQSRQKKEAEANKPKTAEEKKAAETLALAAAAAWGGVSAKETKDPDEQGWISNNNLTSVTESLKKKDAAENKKFRVGCITTDFAMQNVLLQMGINVVSVDGLLIHQIKTFALKCESCFKITHDPLKRFCPQCGLPTLYKITVTSDNDGNISYRLPRIKRTTTRGSRYPLPLMKMGRVDNIVLTEDQKELHRPRKKDGGYQDLLKNDYVTGDSPFKMTDKMVNAKKGIGLVGTMNRNIKIGIGRNPNAVRKRTGNKKKK